MLHLLVNKCKVGRKVTEEFNSVMNGKVESRKKNSSWESVLLVKARELSHHLVGKRKTIEFMKPVYVTERDDLGLFKKKKKTIPQNQLLFQIINCRENINLFNIFV